MYRLRTPDTHKPLFVSNAVIEDYSENRVDTLHMKNLLHLGEDRYLTTLLLKHFPMYKTQFVRDAHAYTVAPDEWKILLSQRRRWINSTIHNLGELVFLDRLCGFCCFSMRFVVFIDLVSTIIQPVTVAYVSDLFFGPRMVVDRVFADCLPRLPCGERQFVGALVVDHYVGGHLWFASLGFLVTKEVGHDWLDGVLHLGYSCFLFLPSAVLLLENGRLLLGRHSYGHGRER